MREFKVGDSVRLVPVNGVLKWWYGYVCDADGGIYCVDIDGYRRWFAGDEIELA